KEPAPGAPRGSRKALLRRSLGSRATAGFVAQIFWPFGPSNGMGAQGMARRGRNRAETSSGSRRDAPPGGPAPEPLDAVETCIARARRFRSRGEDRKALVLLREACALDEWRARTWTLLGAMLTDLGQRSEAERAL